ncbi:MAG: hypothetical protein HQ523_04060 [Lentisphaerae bacterium]|nr:hypothetical protein [Lentisphaerota bacterium]
MKLSGAMWAVVLAVGLAGSSWRVVASEPGRDPEAVRQAFTEVASRLDQGGDLMIVANVDGLIERYMSDMVEVVSSISPDDEKAQLAKESVEKLHLFLKKNGFYAINGLGMSSVPRADGQNVIKTFVSRDAEAAALPLWRALVGGAPRELLSTRFLPAETELAQTGTADVKQLWALIQQAMAEVAPAEKAQAFAQSLEGVTMMVGTPLDELIGSIGADSAFGIQFSRDATITIPAGTNTLTIASPSILLAIQVKDDSLMALVKKQVAAIGMPLTELQVEGTTVYSLNLPVPVVPVQLSLAQHEGYLLIGTMAQVVTEAIKAYADRGGLMADERFKLAFAGQPVKNNGMVYVSERFGTIIKGIQESAMAMTPATAQQGQGSLDLMRRMLDRQQQYSCAVTRMNYKSGVRSSGTTSSSGQQLVASMAIAPVGLMAAIAIPSFIKARGTSQQNACIINLRKIEDAKKQWAMAETKSDGDEADVSGVSQYIRGNTIPSCPAGGVYTVGPLGVSPTCSNPKHMIR